MADNLGPEMYTPTTPTTEQVRRRFIDGWERDGFDRWLAAERDKVRAEVVSEIREYISRVESTRFLQGWNRAVECVVDHIKRSA